MVSESKKKTNAAWDKKNMTIIGCRVRREKAEAFKAVCAANGTNPNAVLLATVNATLDAGEPPEALSDNVSGGGGVLTLETLRLAAEAAQKTGETVSAFLERAISVQAQRDGVSFRMGTNPATGEKMSRDKKAEAPDNSEASAP